MSEKDEVELALRVKIPVETLRMLGALIAESISQHLTPPSQASVETESVPRLFIVGHKVVVPRLNGFQEVANAVQRFSRLEESSEDVAIYYINRLSLWKAAEQGLTPDEVIEVLKRYGRTPPKPSLRNWIARVMSTYGAVRIIAGDGYNILETADATLMDRLLSFKDVKSCIYRRLSPTQARIVRGRRAELKRILLDKGYPVKDYGIIEEFKPIKISLKDGFQPRDYQLEALERFLKAGSGVVILPPGTGKTVIAVMATAHLKAPTLVLCTRAEICKQFRNEYLKHTTISPDDIAVITAETPLRQRVVKPITITTYQMATGKELHDIWKTKWGLVVLDECQHTPSKVWRRVMDIQAIRRLGLTGTPVREDRLEKMIFALIGPPIIDRPWLEMAEEGWIAEAELYEVLVDLPPKLRAEYEKADDWGKVLITAMNPRKIEAVKEILKKHKGEPTLIINFYVDSALKLGKELGIPVITGKTPQRKRHELYQAFREGTLTSLVITSVGEEGIDLPNAKVGINVNGLYGSRMGFTQRFGRVLRPKEGKAVFYELVTEGTVEEEYSERRRAYLLSKGYEFNTLRLTPSGLKKD